ncbi:MAG: hypothetical protein PHV34_09270 [Verrucomicrobiae bacterium]|nr:hypothetical protein [Verrucomicrobiae bacterium]
MKIEALKSQTPASQTTPSDTPPPRHRQTANLRRSGQKSRHVAPRLAGRLNGKDNPNPAPEAEAPLRSGDSGWHLEPKDQFSEYFLRVFEAIEHYHYAEHVLDERMQKLRRAINALPSRDILPYIIPFEDEWLYLRQGFGLVKLANFKLENDFWSMAQAAGVKVDGFKELWSLGDSDFFFKESSDWMP